MRKCRRNSNICDSKSKWDSNIFIYVYILSQVSIFVKVDGVPLECYNNFCFKEKQVGNFCSNLQDDMQNTTESVDVIYVVIILKACTNHQSILV